MNTESTHAGERINDPLWQLEPSVFGSSWATMQLILTFHPTSVRNAVDRLRVTCEVTDLAAICDALGVRNVLTTFKKKKEKLNS